MGIDILMIVLSSLIEVLDAIEPFFDCRLGIFLLVFFDLTVANVAIVDWICWKAGSLEKNQLL